MIARFSALAVLFATLLATTFAASAADDKKEGLQYAWKKGQAHAYRVTIEIDQGDYVDLLSGTPLFTVKDANMDGIQISLRGGLTERRQNKPGKRVIGPSSIRSPFSPFTGVGPGRGMDFTINRLGEVVSSKGSSQLPYLLGDLRCW